MTTTTTEMTPIDPSNDTILVIPRYPKNSYLASGDGSWQVPTTINAPQSDFSLDAKFALVNGELHIFGGYDEHKKIGRLDGCTFIKLSVELNEPIHSSASAVSIDHGRKALICFGFYLKNCEIFDGTTSSLTFSSRFSHDNSGLGIYKGQAVSVGCSSERHTKTETLFSNGWSLLTDIPESTRYHSLIGLEDQSLLLIGGYSTQIWQLKDDAWSRIGELIQSAAEGSTLRIGRSIYYFAGFPDETNSDPSTRYPMQRIDLGANGEISNVEFIGQMPTDNYWPILFEASSSDFCL